METRPEPLEPGSYCLECFFLLQSRFGLVWSREEGILRFFYLKFWQWSCLCFPKVWLGAHSPDLVYASQKCDWAPVPQFWVLPYLGIRVIMPSLMCSEVNPRANMALKASSHVGATSFTYSWKNSVRIPSLLKTFFTSTCIIAQSRCRLRKALMPKMMVS